MTILNISMKDDGEWRWGGPQLGYSVFPHTAYPLNLNSEVMLLQGTLLHILIQRGWFLLSFLPASCCLNLPLYVGSHFVVL